MVYQKGRRKKSNNKVSPHALQNVLKHGSSHGYTNNKTHIRFYALLTRLYEGHYEIITFYKRLVRFERIGKRFSMY